MWFTIFCLAIGFLIALVAEWVAKAIEEEADYATIGWRLIVFAWVIYAAAIGVCAHVGLGLDKEVRELKERVVELENQIQAPTDTLTINDSVQ